ncbi:MAG: Ig-like domain repeat protein, partial [Terracidiphilus sp.]
MIGTYCRSLRLHWIAGLGSIALALSPAARAIPGYTTSTTLTAQSSTETCPTSTSGNQMTTTLTTLTVTVTSSGGVPQGAVNIEDGGNAIASATLLPVSGSTTEAMATVSLYLANGSHSLVADYTGSSPFLASDSSVQPVPASISSQCTTSFAISVSGITPSTSGAMTVTPGETGSATVTVTPSQEYVDSLVNNGTPAFVTVSCTGLPTLATCSFTPEILQIVPGQDAGVNSTMLIQTQSATVRAVPPAPLGHTSNPVVWAILLPGMLGLGGLA